MARPKGSKKSEEEVEEKTVEVYDENHVLKTDVKFSMPLKKTAGPLS